jgi:hypothetical protein
MMAPFELIVCYHCGTPKEVDHEKSVPGIVAYAEIHYKPCTCGQTGIRRQNDLYQEIHRKKTNVAPYERSPYRGGKL